MNTQYSLTSLYRAYLRQVRRLPHLYLRQFFQIRARDDIDSVLDMMGDHRRSQKLKRISRRVDNIERAIGGDRKAFQRILDLAYGRVGKLKWELLEPIMTDSSMRLPDPIIRGVETSRPPVYTPELRALLTSSVARSTKPLEPKDLAQPRTLPPRANPSSEEARLLGPFSKRREVNIRWRFFRNEAKKILPPLESVVKSTGNGETNNLVTPRKLEMEDAAVFKRVEELVGDPFTCLPMTRRERRQQHSAGDTSLVNFQNAPIGHPSRWIKRRYRALLARLPRLVSDGQHRTFKVELSPLAHIPNNPSSKTICPADPITMVWIEQDEQSDNNNNNMKRK